MRIALSLAVALLIARAAMAQDITTLQARAEGGDAAAQYNLGLAYYNGEGAPTDLQEAAHWFRMASDQGLAAAAANLGLMYFKGEGLPVDRAEAVRLFRIGAEGGDALAQLCLGSAYATGEQVAKDAVESAKWMRLAAEQGNAQAQFNFGNAVASGNGVDADPAEAGLWWYRAGLQGYGKARANLGNLDFWRKAALQSPGVQCWIGIALLFHGDPKGGLANLRKAGEGGYREAQAILSAGYYEGNIAGIRLPRDLKESLRWSRLAAMQGDAGCEYNLGMAYLQGEGIEKDQEQAIAWLLKAAAQGYVDAYFNLGALFNMAAKSMEGAARDEILVKAYMFFAIAATKDGGDAGRAQAKAAMATLAAKMSPEQVMEGERQAKLYGK